MLKQRILSASVFVPLFLGIAWLGGRVFDLFLAIILGFAAYEYARMMKDAQLPVSTVLMIGAVLVVVALRIFGSIALEFLALPVILAVLGVYALWNYEKGENKAFQSVVFQFFGVVFIGVLGAFGITLHHTEPNGNLWVVVVIALVWLVDAGAYLIGTRFGKRLALPHLSPKKTWEGFLGGTLVGLLSGVAIGFVLNRAMPELGPLRGGVLGLIMGPVAFFGDALMSLLKRTMGVKDTGKLLPGHGGILDRLDSMLWALVVGTYFVSLLG